MDTNLDIEQLKIQLLKELSSDMMIKNIEPENNGFNRTDAGNAELFAELFKKTLRYNHSKEEWLQFENQYWQPDGNGRVTQCAIDAARYRMKLAAQVPEKDERQREEKWALVSESLSKLMAVQKISKTLTPLKTQEPDWQQDPFLIQFENGVYDLEKHVFRDGKPEDMIFQSVGYDYDPKAKCQTWMSVISEVFALDDELIDYFHKLVGYTITGSISDQAFYILLGDGCNGKSVVMNTIKRALGEYSLHTDYSSFELKNNQQSNDIARIAHSRLVISSELPSSKRLDEARIKAITGGDPITARFLYKEPFTFTPYFKIWMALNTFPSIRGTDNGIWRRIRVIPFNVCFTGREVRGLENQLIPEIPGIMNWAIEGAKKYQDEGLVQPQSMMVKLSEHRLDSDSVMMFLSSELIRTKTGSISSRSLYNSYVTWSKAKNIYPESQITFGQRLHAKGYRSYKSAGYKVYKGISLATGVEENEV